MTALPARTTRLALALLAATATAPLAAQTPAAEVVVTGTRLPLTPAGLAQSVTVIDAQQIRQSGAARIEDLLARVSGAYVDQAGPAGGFVSMYMRGAENSHLLIMLDGVKLNDPTTTRGSAFDLSAIDLDSVERIEVLRGPASALYGGEALAGVVHIITRRPAADGSRGSAYAAAGGGHHRKLGAALAFGQPALQAQFSAGRSEEGAAGSNATLRLDSLSGALRFTPGETLSAELFGHRAERDSSAFPDDSGGPRLAVNRELTRRGSTDQTYGLRLAGGDPGRVRVQAGVTRFDRSEQAANAAVDGGVRFPVPAFTSDTRYQRRNAYLTASHDYGGGSGVVVGAEHQSEDGRLTSIGDFFGLGSPQDLNFALERKTTSLFAEARIELRPGLAVQLGLRRDKVQGLDAETTPHLGLVWAPPGSGTTLKANFNKGYKPPSFFALGFPVGGNPDLRPERSRNAELTLAQRYANGVNLQLALFQTDYEDLVDFDGDTFRNVNRGRIVVKGLEPTLTLRLSPRWRADIALTLLKIDERDGLQPLRNRPERTASASIVHELGPRSTLFVGIQHSGSFLDRSNPTGDIGLPGSTRVDAGYTWRADALAVTLALDNLLDSDHEPFVGFPMQGRRLRLGLRYGF